MESGTAAATIRGETRRPTDVFGLRPLAELLDQVAGSGSIGAE
jgi:hypothetical protein